MQATTLVSSTEKWAQQDSELMSDMTGAMKDINVFKVNISKIVAAKSGPNLAEDGDQLQKFTESRPELNASGIDLSSISSLMSINTMGQLTKKQTYADILFVDDEQSVLSGFRRVLRNIPDRWRCHYVTSVEEALKFTRLHSVDVVVSDISMPVKNGFDLLEDLRSDLRTKDLPVVIVTGNVDEDLKCKALDLGASDLLTKPVSKDNLLARVRNVLKLKNYQDEIKEQNLRLDLKVKARTRELEDSRLDIIWRLAKIVESRDSHTGNHIFRVAHYCKILATNFKMPAEFCEQIFQASPLHDIGKIGIPDSILHKPGRLSKEEFRVMENHCHIGAEILQQDMTPPLLNEETDPSNAHTDTLPQNPLMKMAADIALYHHEHWDGRGYPTGSKGTQIPLAARICAIADVFDALSSARSYKNAMPESEVMRIMCTGKGAKFDAAIFDCFEKSLSEFRKVRKQFADS